MRLTPNPLTRKKASNIFTKYRKNITTYSKEEVITFLNNIYIEFNKCQVSSNENFVFAGRKKIIYDELFNVLDGIQKESDPIYFALGTLQEFICDINHIYISDNNKEGYAILREKNDKYSNTGYICFEELNYIYNIINKIKEYLFK